MSKIHYRNGFTNGCYVIAKDPLGTPQTSFKRSVTCLLCLGVFARFQKRRLQYYTDKYNKLCKQVVICGGSCD